MLNYQDMATIQDKIKNAQQNRSNAMNAVIGIDSAVIEQEGLKELGNKFLFGEDSSDYGIITLFQYYYYQAFLCTGFKTQSPDMSVIGSKGEWLSKFTKASSPVGDGEGGIYPIDPETGSPQLEMNESCNWFSDNEPNGEMTQGIIKYITDSVSASSSIITKRAEMSTGDTPVLLHPDYYGSSERSSLLNALGSIISELDGLALHTQNTIDVLNDINSGGGTAFQEFTDMIADLPMSDISTMNTFISSINSEKATVQGIYDYFASFSAGTSILGQTGYIASEFENNLNSLSSDLSSLSSLLTSRVNAISSILGNTTPPFSGLRKWRYYWISENISKPSAPYISIAGMATARAQAMQGLSVANTSLSMLFGDVNRYCVQPTIFAVVNNPILAEDNSITGYKVEIIAMGATHCNKFKLYRKEITNKDSIPLSNDNWSESDLFDWIVDVNPETGMVMPKYLDEAVTIDNSYCYRLVACDTNAGVSGDKGRIDTFDSYSDQSNILSGATATITGVKDFMITFDSELTFLPNTYLAITSGSNAGVYLVVSQDSPTSVTITENLTNSIGEQIEVMNGTTKVTI